MKPIKQGAREFELTARFTQGEFWTIPHDSHQSKPGRGLVGSDRQKSVSFCSNLASAQIGMGVGSTFHLIDDQGTLILIHTIVKTARTIQFPASSALITG